jgi:hypothetical protein
LKGKTRKGLALFAADVMQLILPCGVLCGGCNSEVFPQNSAMPVSAAPTYQFTVEEYLKLVKLGFSTRTIGWNC